MAVARDTQSAAQTFGGASAVNWSHTASGADRYARVSAGFTGFSSTTVSSATYGGASMGSPVANVTNTSGWGGAGGFSYIWGIVAPSTSAQTVQINLSAGSNAGAAGSASYTGVHQSSPNGAAFTGQGDSSFTAASVVVTDAVTGDMVSDCITINTGGVSGLTAGKTQIFSAQDSGGYYGAAQDASGAASVTMDWSWTGTNSYAMCAAAIKQVAGGTTQDLAGAAAAQATASAAAAVTKPLAGAAAGAAAATADLAKTDTLAGSAQGVASATGQLQGGATITTPPLKNNTGTLLASEAGATVHVYTLAGALVVTKTGQTTNGSGVMAINDALLNGGTTYRVVFVLASGAEGMDKLAAA